MQYQKRGFEIQFIVLIVLKGSFFPFFSKNNSELTAISLLPPSNEDNDLSLVANLIIIAFTPTGAVSCPIVLINLLANSPTVTAATNIKSSSLIAVNHASETRVPPPVP